MPRLSKGEIAPGVKSRQDAAIQTIAKRVEIFYELIANNAPSLEMLSVYQSINKLAEWEERERGVFPISVKTLRRHIGLFYKDGLRALCQAAREKYTAVEKPRRLPLAINDKGRTEQAIDSALEMTVRYLDLLERMRRLAHTSQEVDNEVSKHFRRFGKNPHIREIL